MTKASFFGELRSCTYYAEFEKPKIVYPNIARFPSACYEIKGTLGLDTTFFIPHERSFFARYSK